MIYKHGGRGSNFTQFLHKTVFCAGFILHHNMEGVHFENVDFYFLHWFMQCPSIYCYVHSLPLCYFTQSALPNYQTGCCSVLHVLLCPAKRIKQARCLFVTLLKLSSRDR